QPCAQCLQQDRHQIGEQRNGKQRVSEFGPAGERRRPVARVHVANRDQITRAKERNELPAERTCRPGGDRAEYLCQWRPAALPSPAAGFWFCALAYGRFNSQPLYSVANNLQLQLFGTFQILSSYRALAACRGGVAQNRYCIAARRGGRRAPAPNAARAGRT